MTSSDDVDGPLDEDAYPGTQPADAMSYDSLATMRPMATQAVFRPNFDDSDGISVSTADTEPHEQATMMTRLWSPIRRLGGGLVECRGCPSAIRWKR
jgi:serine/threonine-protein kinase PknG